MCLLAIHLHVLPAAPLLVAANREEYYDRPATAPSVIDSRPKVLCGTDQRAGGTWLGVNQFGLLVAVTNRAKQNAPENAPSRGVLCRDLLLCSSAAEAVRMAERELATGRYAGANYLCADGAQAWIVESGDRLQVERLAPGLCVLSNGPPNSDDDPRQRRARELFAGRPFSKPAEYIEAAASVCAAGADGPACPIVVRDKGRGTVSSTLIALTSDPRGSIYRFAPGAPDVTAYDDYSAQLTAMLAERAIS